MSGQYWSRKLADTYVYHQGKYKQITALKMKTNEPLDDRYPEDSLPYVRFQLDGGERWYKRDTFEIRFPDEGYAMVNDRPVFAGRTMERAWKIAPSRDNYLCEDNFQDWLNAPAIEYDQPEALLDWDKNCIFTPKLAAITTSMYSRSLLFCNHKLATLSRSRSQMTLMSDYDWGLVNNLCAPWKPYWNQTWDHETDFLEDRDLDLPSLPSRPGNNEYIDLVHYRWRYRPRTVVDNWDYIVTRNEEWGTHIVIRYEDENWVIPSFDEVSVCFHPARGERGLMEDLSILLMMYELEPPAFNFKEEIGFI